MLVSPHKIVFAKGATMLVSLGDDIHPFPEGVNDGLMDVSSSNTYYMSAPASGPMEYDLAKIQQFV